MVAANLSPAIITGKIAARTVRSTSPEGRRQLTAASVPDAIVVEMIKRSAR